MRCKSSSKIRCPSLRSTTCVKDNASSYTKTSCVSPSACGSNAATGGNVNTGHKLAEMTATANQARRVCANTRPQIKSSKVAHAMAAGVPMVGIKKNPAISVPAAAPSEFTPYSHAPCRAPPPECAVSMGNHAPNASVTGRVNNARTDPCANNAADSDVK